MTGPSAAETLVVHHAVVRTRTTVLVDVRDLTVRGGRPLTIVGESGSGKSVLAHALMGTLPPELEAQGSMSIGRSRFDLADRAGRRRLWGRQVALLPQEPALALDPTMRVRNQVAEGAVGWRPRDTVALGRADERLERLGLEGTGRAFPHTLSGGMAQRVAYAAAIIGGANILLVDEPSKGLDRESLDRLALMLAAHVDRGGLLVTITHDLGLARRLGGDVVVMQDAAVVESGSTDEVLTRPTHPYAKRLLAAEPSRWTAPWTRHTLQEDEASEPLVTAHRVSKAYTGKPLFRDLSVEIRPRERWAVVGPSGVGKTTLGNALLRLTDVDAGWVRHGPTTRGGRIQKLYQDPGLSFPRRVPLESSVRDVMRRHRVGERHVRSLLEEMGVPYDLLRRRPGQVSGGELQRVAIARAMLPRPVVLFADEATSRLDPVSQATTMDLLMRQITADGCALLLVTHDLDLASAVGARHIPLGAALPTTAGGMIDH